MTPFDGLDDGFSATVSTVIEGSCNANDAIVFFSVEEKFLMRLVGYMLLNVGGNLFFFIYKDKCKLQI